jgi:hypothetical protein
VQSNVLFAGPSARRKWLNSNATVMVPASLEKSANEQLLRAVFDEDEEVGDPFRHDQAAPSHWP